jgi:hypothetical protein
MRWLWTILGAGAIALALLAVGVYQVAMLPRTYHEAVMQVLDRRGVRYDEVMVVHRCPPCYSPEVYAVRVTGPVQALGVISCQVRESASGEKACILWLSEFGLRDAPLPPLARDPQWLVWLRQQLRYLSARLPA